MYVLLTVREVVKLRQGFVTVYLVPVKMEVFVSIMVDVNVWIHFMEIDVKILQDVFFYLYDLNQVPVIPYLQDS